MPKNMDFFKRSVPEFIHVMSSYVIHVWYPIENGPVEIVDLPIEHGGSFPCFLGLFTKGWSSHDDGEYPNWQISFRGRAQPPTSPCKMAILAILAILAIHPGRPSGRGQRDDRRAHGHLRWHHQDLPRSEAVGSELRLVPGTDPWGIHGGSKGWDFPSSWRMDDVGWCWMVIWMIFRIYIYIYIMIIMGYICSYTLRQSP